MRSAIVALAMLASGIGAAALAQRPAAADWRRLATAPDRSRLRGWRSAWGEALDAARGERQGALAIAADAALFDPDRTLSGAMPPAGAYDCRLVKLGRRGSVGAVYTAQRWARCRIDESQEAGHFTALDGRQRPTGLLLADTDARAVFLGSMTLSDERPLDYGRDTGRDMIGLMERIGPERWRLVLPRPAYQSILDVIEVRPAGQGVAAGSAGSVAR